MTLEKLDHLVLPVSDIDTIAMFYTTYLGMEKRIFGNDRVALHFGDQKINLHPAGWNYEPKARVSVRRFRGPLFYGFGERGVATNKTCTVGRRDY